MKKEWIIWAVIGLLAIALVVGVVVLSNATIHTPTPPPNTKPTTEAMTQGTEETTGDTQGSTTGPEEQTTVPDETTTAPEEETMSQETTDPTEDTTTPPKQEGEGNGFEERDPVKPTKPTEDKSEEETTAPTTQPEETDPPTKEEMTYKEYLALTTEEQLAFRKTFPSNNAFKNWYLAAKKKYEDSQEQVTMGPGNSIDLGELIGTEP